MKAVIVGCGRVGAALADELDRAGWQVLIIDLSTSAFDRLPSTFGGTARRGDGTDEDSLLQHGAADADLFLALTEGDNRNVMAAQLAIEALGARRCVAKINDPVRAEAYAHLGIAALCRTNLMTTAVLAYAGPGHRDEARRLRARAAARARRRGRPPVPRRAGDDAGRRRRRPAGIGRDGGTRRAAGGAGPAGVRTPCRAPAHPARRADRCSCWSWAAARSATT